VDNNDARACSVVAYRFTHLLFIWPCSAFSQNRTFERLVCILVPALYLVASYHKRYYSSFQVWPYPFFNLFTSSAHFAMFCVAMLLLLVGLTLGFQKVRDRAWEKYIVPKHLQLQTA
jgi:hypothetical protein